MSKLLSLPPEVLRHIARQLGPSPADFHHSNAEYMPHESLASLTRTCGVFHVICEPMLYEICNARSDVHSKTRGLGVLRRLVAEPALRLGIKRIIVSTEFYMKDPVGDVVISADEAELYNRILEESLDIAPDKRLRELRDSEYLDPDDAGEAFGGPLACTALALAPNITSAILVGHSMPLECFKPDFFPNLEAFSVESVYVEPVKLDDAKGVLLAAPKARRLVGRMVGLDSEVTYSFVQQLTLVNCRLADADLALLPAAFPNLELFTYLHQSRCADDSVRSPRGTSKVLLSLRKTLKQVFLSTYENDPDDEPDPIDAPGPINPANPIAAADKYMESLAQMEVLEHLRLHVRHIYHHEDLEAEYSSSMELVDFLPKSLQSLYLEGVESSDGSRILALAKSAPDMFPSLARVTLPGLYQSLKEVVRQAFAKHKIECSFEQVVLEGTPKLLVLPSLLPSLKKSIS